MPTRLFRPEDAPALAELAAQCARNEGDFVLNPLWETPQELFAEFERHGSEPTTEMLVAEEGDGEVVGLAGFLRSPQASAAGLLCPIVARGQRGQGLGGELLRGALDLGRTLGIRLVTAGIGTRNRSGYSLLCGRGFRPTRQHFLMRCTERPATAKVQPHIELDTAQPADTEEILDLYHACGFDPRSIETMRSILADGRHAHSVARSKNRVVAFTELETHWPERVWVSFVGVQEEMRGKGLGSALVAWALNPCFDDRAHSAMLLLSPANREALRAYEKVGLRRYRVIDVLEAGL